MSGALIPSKAAGAIHLKQLKLVYVELPVDLPANSPMRCTDAMHSSSAPDTHRCTATSGAADGFLAMVRKAGSLWGAS